MHCWLSRKGKHVKIQKMTVMTTKIDGKKKKRPNNGRYERAEKIETHKALLHGKLTRRGSILAHKSLKFTCCKNNKK